MRSIPDPMRSSSSFFTAVVLSAVLFSACGSQPKKPDDKATQIKEYTSTIRTSKDAEDPVHGKETAFLYGAVTGVGGSNANGVAFLHTYEDGFTVITVNLNILLAPSGEHYEAYLSDGVEENPVDLGLLRSIIGDVRHNLQYEEKNDLGDRRLILIKLGSKTIAEGALKTPSAPVK